MKNLIKHFVTKTPMWLVFLTWSFLFISLTYSCMYWLLPSTDFLYKTISTAGTIVGLLWGVFISLLTYEIRKSINFWDYAEEVSKLISGTNSLSRLNDIKECELHKLSKMSSASIQSAKVDFLKAFLDAKIRMLESVL